MFQVEQTCRTCGGRGCVWGNGDRISYDRWLRLFHTRILRLTKPCPRCGGARRKHVTKSFRQLRAEGLLEWREWGWEIRV